jgi:hypothetical protein
MGEWGPQSLHWTASALGLGGRCEGADPHKQALVKRPNCPLTTYGHLVLRYAKRPLPVGFRTKILYAFLISPTEPPTYQQQVHTSHLDVCALCMQFHTGLTCMEM